MQLRISRVAVCGPKGCGKTSLINFCCGIYPKCDEEEYIPTTAITERLSCVGRCMLLFTEYPHTSDIGTDHDIVIVVVDNNNFNYQISSLLPTIWVVSKFDIYGSARREILVGNRTVFQVSARSHHNMNKIEGMMAQYGRKLVQLLNG